MSKPDIHNRESLPESWQPALEGVESIPDQLDNVEKLRALYDDPRAQFLPATHTEKSEALPLLDYLPSIKPGQDKGHPARTAGKLQEVFIRQKNIFMKTYGLPKDEAVQAASEAIRSIVCSYGDFLLNAASQQQRLNQLKAAVDEVHPGLSLMEAAGEENLGIPAFVRYFDLRMLMQSKPPIPGIDTQSPIVDRYSERDENGRAKIIHDQYTIGTPPEPIKKRIDELATTLTIGSIRTSRGRGKYNLLDMAVINEANRKKFWTKRLEESRNHLAARSAAQTILSIL